MEHALAPGEDPHETRKFGDLAVTLSGEDGLVELGGRVDPLGRVEEGSD